MICRISLRLSDLYSNRVAVLHRFSDITNCSVYVIAYDLAGRFRWVIKTTVTIITKV